jgi:hypothetical protein
MSNITVYTAYINDMPSTTLPRDNKREESSKRWPSISMFFGLVSNAILQCEGFQDKESVETLFQERADKIFQ